MKAEDFKVEADDGLELHGITWWPAKGARAAIWLVHGLGEHGGRYDYVAEAFNAKGFAMAACDLRGHGRSGGKRGHSPSYDLLMNDIALGLGHVQRQLPGLPLFLYGHSLGGNLVLYYVLRRQPQLAGVVATAPLLRLVFEPPALQIFAMRLLNALHINMTMPSGLDDTALSRDLNVVRTYRNDPLTHRLITPRLAVDMIDAGAWNLSHATELTCPLLLMHGDADRITSAAASQEFAERARTACTFKRWNGYFHELHNEPGKQDVLACMLDWLDDCLSSIGLNGGLK